MEEISFFLELAKIALPALLVGAVAVYFVKAFINKDQQLRILEAKITTKKETVLLRLQAYERLILLLERIHPGAVISRLSLEGLSAKQLQMLLTANIQTEFEHNLSQQLYISSEAWNLVSSAKNELVKFINLFAAQQSSELSAAQFSQLLLDIIAKMEQPLPTQTALEFLKAEARELL